jgi:hypothetical protein
MVTVAIDLAIILDKMGEREEVMRIFNQHYNESGNNIRHIEYLKELTKQHN